MCILCDHGTLELLTTPLERLAPGQLAEAVRTAREAAEPGVLDFAETVLRGEAVPELGLAIFDEVVVARAREAGLLARAGAGAWAGKAAAEQSDPRVLAFVSSCAEIVDDYRVLLAERKQVVERYVEARGDAVRFTGIGQDGELWFDHQGNAYAALNATEAIEIVEREIGSTLHSLPLDDLLGWTRLPDAAREVLEEVRTRPAETANAVLAELVDLPAIADERVRQEGYAPFFRGGEEERQVEDLRFGEWILIRFPSDED